MAHHHADPPIPRAILLGAGALILLTLAFVGGGKYADIGTTGTVNAAVAESRTLQFRDRADGAAEILLADTGQVIAILQPGAGDGFIRGVLRGLARERMLNGVGRQAPFVLNRRVDGTLSLDDPATGRRIDLRAFGPDNAETFARLLVLDPRPRTVAARENR